MEGMEQVDGNALFSLFGAIVLARWIHFAAVFILFGSALFWFYMPDQRGFAAGDDQSRTLRATVRLLQIAAPVAAISGAFWIAALFANMTNGFGGLLDPDALGVFFWLTQFGPVVVLRLALLAAAVLVVILPWRNRASCSALMHIGALLLVNQAWLGHAAEGGAGLYGALMILVYSIHVLAAGAWVGGLPPLLFALVEQRRFNAPEARDATLEILSRFSIMAMIAVSLMVVTGAANAGFRVGGAFAKIFDADYGYVLAAKAGVIGLMLALAFFNRFVAMPKLRASSGDLESSGDLASIARLRTSVALELGLGVLVLALASLLGVTPPPQ